jgi:hypothetical protein
MGTPTSWRDCSLTSPALDRNDLVVWKGAKRIRAFHIHSIRSSGTSRHLHSGRCERCPSLSQLFPSPTNYSDRSIACELRRPSRLVIGIRFSKGNPTTFRDSSLSSAALERTELMVGKCAKLKRAVPFHSIRYSEISRLSPARRWRVRRHDLIRFAASPTINSVRSIPCELRRTSRSILGFLLEISI